MFSPFPALRHLVAAGLLLAAGARAGLAPATTMKLTLTAPITTWDEAIPLGNGLLGGLLWGEGSTLRLSLDRGDLWDERPAPGNPLAGFTYARLTELANAHRNEDIKKIVDEPYFKDHPTKIPAGRVELDLAEGQRVTSFELDLTTATGRAALGAAGSVEAFFSAIDPVALLRIPGPAPRGLRLLAPESVKKLGYPDPVRGRDGTAEWFTQTTAEGHVTCVYAGTRRLDGETLVATTVAYSPADGTDVVAAARARVDAALAAGFAAKRQPHVDWWHDFWEVSSVAVPDEQVQRHYNLVQYFYGAASRTGAPPIPLQGVWTADAGELPPWKGDYHHDLNTQMTYMGYQASGRFDEGRVFLDFMNDRLPAFRKFAHDFLQTKGAAVPAVMTLAGQPLGGWAQYSLAPIHGAWVGHLFYLHWRYTRDEKFLREEAYPWCREIGEALQALLKPDANGVLVLPLSASPEAWNNDQRAWVKPNSNFDIACLRMLYLGNQEMAAALGDARAAAEWGRLAAAVGPLHVNARHQLMISPDEDLTFSHRHLATVMGIYPFNLLNIEGTDEDRAVIKASVHDLDRLGVLEWCGYSYTWMSALRARIGEPEPALWYLKAYLHAFLLRNGFHANGDQTKSGFSIFDYRPFTLEGNFLACAAVHEMLLQSWHAHPGTGGEGPIRIFPAMPWKWHEAAFANLIAEGGHRVSATRQNNATTWLQVIAAHDGEIRIRDNFDGRVPVWNRPNVRKDGADFVFKVKARDAITATLAKPAAIPPPPADAMLDDVPKPPKDPGVPMSPPTPKMN
ncbi:MAG TPA: glycoside hydrolase N-terminal domain-containing protein [Opitutaceae bacterium]|nr:glycoside hydrolase N-terminal domain-containing protein [Opitutaceae bacterium]